MHTSRLASVGFAALLAVAGCGKARTSGTDLGTVTLPGGAVDGSDVTVEARWCVRCHGDAGRAPAAGDAAGVAFAPPLDVSGAASGATVGAHLPHLKVGAIREGVPCSSCHVIPATADAHVPGVALRGLASAQGASPTYAGGTCSATYCHGNFFGGVGSVSVSWTGGALTCGVSCHQTPPPNGTHAGKAFPASCPSCHGETVDASGNILVANGTHINGVVDGGCTGCHGTDGRPDGDLVGFPYDTNQQAAPPLDTNGAATGVLVGAHLSHVNPTQASAVYKPIACTECHPDNTTQVHPDNAQAEVNFLLATAADLGSFTPAVTLGDGSSTPTTCTTYCHNGPFADGYGGSAAPWAWDGPPATCASCHGDPPTTLGHVGLDATTNCGLCHPGYTATTVDLATHINGQLDGGESLGGQSCGACHRTIFEAMNGTVAKVSRHSLGNVAGTNDSPTDSGITWGSPLDANTPGSRSCVNMCHGDHPHDLTSPVVSTHEYNAYLESTSAATRGGTTRTSATRARTDFLVGETNGGLCTSCHRNPIAAGGPTVSVATFGAAAHDFTSASGSTWRFQLHAGAFDRNCTKCHSSPTEGTTPTVTVNSSGANSVHFSANPALLAGKLNPAGAAAGFVCYNCHGSAPAPANGAQGNRSGKDVQTQIAKTRSHPANADAVHDSAAELAGAAWGNALGGKPRHASCLDCHAPHGAKAGLHSANLAGQALQGGWGTALTNPPATNFGATVSGSFSVQTITAGVTHEATLCFKCHSTFYWGNGTPPNGLSPNGSSTTPEETDVAREFNPNNASGHPVLAGLSSYPNSLAPKALATAQLVSPWNVNVGTQTMGCSDCHGTDAAAPAVQGPHGSAAQFILKGSNAANWPNVTLNNIATAWCANCHVNARTGNNAHSNGNHSAFQCYRCHIVVPHGGKLSRLMADNDTMPSRYAYNGTLNTSSLQGFTKASSPTGYGQSNCRAQCAGEHSGRTPAENW